MIDILKNNLNEFDINEPNNSTIICDANQIENSAILQNLSPSQKSNIHLNINIYCDKDIESFIYLEQNCKYKSINIIFHEEFNLSKLACQKLNLIININSVFQYTNDNKVKGGSFKNYILTTTILENPDTNMLLSNDALLILKKFSKKSNNIITFTNLSNITKEVLIFLKNKNIEHIILEIDPNNKLEFNLETLFLIIERINTYTNSVNINIDNILKFNIIYKKILKDIENDYNTLIKNSLVYSGYSIIIYQTLQNLKINCSLTFGKINTSNTEQYYNQIYLNKYWFNLDIIWNHENNETNSILKNDKEFFKTHSHISESTNKCTISYKKHLFFVTVKKRFLVIFKRNKKEQLQLPSPKYSIENNEKSIFQNI